MDSFVELAVDSLVVLAVENSVRFCYRVECFHIEGCSFDFLEGCCFAGCCYRVERFLAGDCTVGCPLGQLQVQGRFLVLAIEFEFVDHQADFVTEIAAGFHLECLEIVSVFADA